MKTLLFVGGPLPLERVKDLVAGSTLTLIGETSTLAAAHRLMCDAGTKPADMLLADLGDPPDGSEPEMVRAIRGARPATKIMVLGDAASLARLWHACGTEIDGYVLHTMPPAMLLHAIELILSGQRILPPCSHAAGAAVDPVPGATTAAPAPNGLSAREAQILQLLVAGSSNKAIARDLTISHETVKVHIRALLRKLKARNRTQAALWGLANGFRQVGCLVLSMGGLTAASEAGTLGLWLG